MSSGLVFLFQIALTISLLAIFWAGLLIAYRQGFHQRRWTAFKFVVCLGLATSTLTKYSLLGQWTIPLLVVSFTSLVSAALLWIRELRIKRSTIN